MATTQIQTVSPAGDKIKLLAALVLVVGAVVAFYLLKQQGQVAQWAALIVFLGAATASFFWTESGRQLIAFGRDALREVKKVVWPSRKESLQMTAYVFGFVFIMAVFLWVTDKTLEWFFYDLILGWKK